MIIDPGTEIDVIGGVGWFILNVVDGAADNLGGALAGGDRGYYGESSFPHA